MHTLFKSSCFVLINILMLTAQTVPARLDYQGTLTDTAGIPLTEDVSINFAIYGVETGGSALWNETQSPVTVTDGLFHVLLGSVTPLPESLFDAPDRWIGLSVNGDGEMTPRTRLASVPFAMVAANPGPVGPQGPQGDTGPQGPTGPQGDTGPQGEPGADGLNCWDLNGDAVCDAVEDVNNDAVCDASDCTGPQGDTGAQGPQGDQGNTGPQGPQGEPGTDGLNCWDLDGDTVCDAVEDVNNDAVCDASDCTGSQGETGQQGIQGDTGPQGPQGPQGSTGPQGPQGVAGADGLNCWDLDGDTVCDAVEDVNNDAVCDASDCTGPQGDTGPQGPQGLTGPQGPQGVAGADGLNCWDLDGDTVCDAVEDVNNDAVCDASDCTGPQGDTGPQGPQGVQGDQGPAGPVAGSNGQVIYNNNGSAGGAEIYYDDVNQRLGVGTSTPAASLDINSDDGVLFGGTYGAGSIPVEGTGTRLMWYPAKAALRAGSVQSSDWDADSIGPYSTAFNHDALASGTFSFAVGENVRATAWYSIAMGDAAEATNMNSTAIGSGTIASGENSTAMGSFTEASGHYSTAMGYGSIASSTSATAMGDNTNANAGCSTTMGLGTMTNSYCATAIGKYNVGLGSYPFFSPDEPLFEIGNGDSNYSRSNALTVLWNGHVGIGVTVPTHFLDVSGSAPESEGLGSFTNTAQMTDSYGLFGRCDTTDYYGYGGFFQGGYVGIEGTVNPSGSHTYYGVSGTVVGGSGVNYAVYGAAYGTGTNWSGYFVGNIYASNVRGSISSSRIDHPLDPENQYLNHSSVESPDMMNVYNGNVILDARGEAVVELPDYFEALNQDYRYQLTCIGGFAPVYIADKINSNQFSIAGGQPGMEVSWQVTGIRHDPVAVANPIVVEEEKKPNEAGKYLNPEAYGLPRSMAIDYDPKREANLR